MINPTNTLFGIGQTVYSHAHTTITATPDTFSMEMPPLPPMPVTQIPSRLFSSVDDEIRHQNERVLLKTQDGVAYLQRLDGRPAQERWLQLKNPQTEIAIPAAELSKQIEVRWLQFAGYFTALIERSGIESLKNKWSQFTSQFKKPRLTRNQAAVVSRLVEELARKGKITEEEKELCRKELKTVRTLSQDALLVENGHLTCRASFWSRDPKRDRLCIPEFLYDDLGTQVLIIKLPNGEPVGGIVLRLFLESHRGGGYGNLFLLSEWVESQPPHPRWIPGKYVDSCITPFVRQLAKWLEAKNFYKTTYVPHLDWRSGLIPVGAPWGAEQMHHSASYFWPHFYANALKWPLGSREVMRPIEGATIAMFNPWLWPELPIPNLHSYNMTDMHHPFLRVGCLFKGRFQDWQPVRNFLLREIDPNPPHEFEMFSGDRYLVALSPNTGRSAGYPLHQYQTTGDIWYYLDAIGVGKTVKARSGRENRDGLLPLEGAQKRFYLTLLMHHVTREYGFRTSLGVAVINRNRIRNGGEKSPGIPQIEASLYELRREQLRLSDLENVQSLRETIDRVQEKISRELGVPKITDKEYVAWLAKTLGEQLAIMTYFGFDHGIFEKTLQLGPWNVSLAGEIFDFDASKLSKPESVAPRYENENQISVQVIYDLQQNWIHGLNNVSWLAILLGLASDVDFYRTMMKGLSDKWNELEDKKVDAKAAIRRFNTEMWNPWFKKLNRNPQAIYHGPNK